MRRRPTRRPAVERLEGRALLATFTVTSTDDSGAGSFRQAIVDANAAPDADRIEFAIPGDGVHTIAPLSPLPGITAPLVIDGYTQPGSHPNTLAQGDDAVLTVALDGSMAGDGAIGLKLNRGPVGVQGLVISGFAGAGIGVYPDTLTTPQPTPTTVNAVIRGNFIGTDATGTLARGNGGPGVLTSWAGIQIGGTDPAARNLISGNGGSGINVYPSASSGLLTLLPTALSIQGNLIGTDATGSHALGNAGDGVTLNAAQYLVIGGSAAEAGNVISANGGSGIKFQNDQQLAPMPQSKILAGFATVQGNAIGTDAAGAAELGNGQFGIDLRLGTAVVVGGTEPGAGNVIVHNPLAAIRQGPGPYVIVGNVTEPNGDQYADLAASVTFSPDATLTVGSSLTATYRVTNNGPMADTGVRLAVGLPAYLATQSATPSRGTYQPGTSGGTLLVGTMAPGESATLTFALTALRPGPQASVGDYDSISASGDLPDYSPFNNTSSMPGPEVVGAPGLSAVLPADNGRRTDGAVVQFDLEMDAGQASNPANYRATVAGHDGRFGTRDDQTIPIAAAYYDPNAQATRLAFRRTLPLGTPVRVTVDGPGAPGLSNATGVPMAGPDFGTAAAGPVVRYTDGDGDRVALRLTGGGRLFVTFTPQGDAQVVTILGASPQSSILSGNFLPARRGSNRTTSIGSIRGTSTLAPGGYRLPRPPFLYYGG